MVEVPHAAWLAGWVPVALLGLLGRRDRRLIYWLPLVGAGVALAGAIGLLVWHSDPVRAAGTETGRDGAAARPLTAGPWVVLLLIAAAGGVPGWLCWLGAYARLDCVRCWHRLRRAWPAACVGLGGLAAASCLSLGMAVLDRWNYSDEFTLFESDGPRYVRFMSGTATGEEPVTHKHPLYVLFARGMYRPAAALLGAKRAPLLVNALAAGGAVALAAAYFRLITGSRALALLLAAALALTAAHLVFGALPETYAPSAVALILLHWLLARGSAVEDGLAFHDGAGGRPLPACENTASAGAPSAVRGGRIPYLRKGLGSSAPHLREGLGSSAPHLREGFGWSGRLKTAETGVGRYLRHEVPAAVLAIGMTVTHVFTAVACFLAARGGRPRCRQTVRWILGVVTLLAAGLTVQSVLVPVTTAYTAAADVSSAVRAAGALLREEARYITQPTSASVASALRNVARGLLAENVIAPTIVVGPDTAGKTGVHLGAYEGWLARVSLGVWWLVLGTSGVVIMRRRAARRPTLWAALLCLLATAALHVFYGNAHVFLFSCTFTFYLFAITAHGLANLPRRLTLPLLGGLVAVLAIRNGLFCAQWLDTLARELIAT